MGVIRRVVLPVLLTVVMVGTGVAAFVLDRGDDTATGDDDVELSTVVTPVLSARRLPEFVTTPGADLTLRLRLIDLVQRAPDATCLVVDADGRDILSHQADRSLVPASNEKTVLAAALLETLGPDHTFTTELRGPAPGGGGVVNGDVWLVGGGDPQLSTDDYAATTEKQTVGRTSIESVADAIADSGVRRIAGRIVADETRYDASRYVPGWPLRYLEQNQTGPLTALSVNDGFGSFPTSANPTAELTASPDPARLAAATLAFLLAERGVTVDNGVDVGRSPRSATPIAAVESAPLSTIVGEMLTFSDNQTAELLLKELGVAVEREGTTAAGARAVGSVLADLDIDTTGSSFVDGSGLSPDNRLTCGVLSRVLEGVGAESPLADGLAVAGESGTLAASFRDTRAEGRLIAKTGSLNDVRSLAGFVESRRDDDLTFSLVINRGPFIEPADEQVRDEIGLVMAAYPQRPPLDEIAPIAVEP